MPLMKSSPLRRCCLDMALFVLAVTVFITGEHGSLVRDTDLHQVLAVIIGSGVSIHVIWQWRWITGTSRHFFGKLAGKVRLNYMVAVFLLVTVLLTLGSGLLISSWVTDAPKRDLVHLHHMAPKFFLLGVVFHTLLHWRWLASTVKKLFGAT